MVVKSRRGRRRYIAFQVSGGRVADEDLLAAINRASSSAGLRPPKLIQFNGRRGIVRTSGEERDRMVEALNRPPSSPGDLSISTLAVSGTLRTLRERFFSEGRGQA